MKTRNLIPALLLAGLGAWACSSQDGEAPSTDGVPAPGEATSSGASAEQPSAPPSTDSVAASTVNLAVTGMT